VKTSPIDEATRRAQWEREKDERQRAENAEVNFQMKRPFGPTPADREQQRRRKIADALGFDPFGGASDE
jgi:hypothetical protein